MCKLCANFKEKMLSKLCVNFIFTIVKVSVKLCANHSMIFVVLPEKF